MPEDDADTRIRHLCQQILEEQDPAQVENLLTTLREMVKGNQDDARLRMSYIAKHYRSHMIDVLPSAEHSEPAKQNGQRIRSVLAFLGLVPDWRAEDEKIAS